MEQNIDRIERDISTIKKTMDRLVELLTEVSLHNKRLEYLEAHTMECAADRKEIWKSLRQIHEKCLMRDSVFQEAKSFFAHGERLTMRDPDQWLTVLLGGALRNGLWIAISALITAIIMRKYGG